MIRSYPNRNSVFALPKCGVPSKNGKYKPGDMAPCQNSVTAEQPRCYLHREQPDYRQFGVCVG